MKTVIIHGKRISPQSPRDGRPECALWGISRANCRYWQGQLHDWTEWVDVHPLTATQEFPGIPERRPDAWKWMREQDGSRPIWLQAPEAHRPEDQALALARFNEIPGARRFPIREVQHAFPVNGEPNRWFVEQAGMMIGKACLDGYERIILNGIGCVSTLAFERTHRSILYWIAYVRGRGLTVEIEGPSIYHMPGKIYAYETFNYEEFARVQREKHAEELGPNLAALAQINNAERRRGRPPKYRLPELVEEWP